ncbi:MAG: PAS domain S-box protein [Flavobacteriales bacterium]|nr:PAS domain S-box protein [Flavobacteriales bacterium]
MTGTFSATDLARISHIMFRSAAEGLVVVDAEGRMRLCNPRLADLFGYKEEELLGQPIEMLLPEGTRHRHTNDRAQYHQHPQQRPMGAGLDLQGRRRNGMTFPLEVSLNHFEVDGIRYVMALVTDISKRRMAELELQQTNVELEHRVERRTAELRKAEMTVREALEKERELNALKSRFISLVSHEFRTPLSAILSSVDLIARYSEGSENVLRHVNKVRTKVRELTTMLNEFLSLERLEQGDLVCEPSRFDVVHLGIELIEELRGIAKAGQDLHFEHLGEEREVMLDRRMVAGIMTNLTSNAIKYSPEGHDVDLRTHHLGDRLRIQVIDHGMGIPEADQQHLFERFYRAHNALTIQGTGLGLNIVKRYVDLMQGSIHFTSKEGLGTTFTVELPLGAGTPDTSS